MSGDALNTATLGVGRAAKWHLMSKGGLIGTAANLGKRLRCVRGRCGFGSLNKDFSYIH